MKVDANGCPLDSDNDGVPDYLDKCPGTPAGVKVDANGCPLDSDNDGVPDYLDKCPGTPTGAKVDTNGCVISITLKINFDSGKAVVKSAYLPEIERFAQFMKQYPDQKAEIQGHSDNVGSAKSNKALSEARAKAVREAAITKYGIAADRLTAKGYGPDKPIASNDTPEGREKNRRVEAVIMQ
ncbi:MAG: OmpA family protein [Nitrospiraceae bacterium]|nr:OmpA family protein [Nitrospiraceae bacterium]